MKKKEIRTVEDLERKLEELEKRIKEMEQKPTVVNFPVVQMTPPVKVPYNYWLEACE